MKKFNKIASTPEQSRLMTNNVEQEPVNHLEYLFSLNAGAKLPLAQSLIMGCSLGVSMMTLAWLVGVHRPWIVGILTLTLSQAGFIILWVFRWFNMTNLERLTGMDLNQDGEIGEPTTVRVEIMKRNKTGYEMQIMELPATEWQLRRLAVGLVKGIAFSERQWTGKNAPFSSSEFRALRSVMIQKGLIRAASEKDNRTGFVLTEAGQALMEQLCKGMEEDEE
jgi:hypothetical protein